MTTFIMHSLGIVMGVHGHSRHRLRFIRQIDIRRSGDYRRHRQIHDDSNQNKQQSTSHAFYNNA
ncbi:MAG: hypothetical protein RQ783_07780 [Gammaproteobacteria bacterium]|nr:hypothetical protein [Gammaproteobacteria bacterium]